MCQFPQETLEVPALQCWCSSVGASPLQKATLHHVSLFRISWLYHLQVASQSASLFTLREHYLLSLCVCVCVCARAHTHMWAETHGTPIVPSIHLLGSKHKPSIRPSVWAKV